MENEEVLKHYGITGMRWGHRKASVVPSSDHTKYKEIRKKKLADMSDDEVVTVTKRMSLVSTYKKGRVPFTKTKKKIEEMSNDELKSQIERNQLIKEDFYVGVRKMKKISQMTDEEVSSALRRHNLEKPYRQLKKEETEKALKVVAALVYGAAKVLS